MKIKIEVDGLTLEHATELTKFLAILNETEKAKKVIDKAETYPMLVRRPYTTETRIVNSIEEHDAFCNGSFNKEDAPVIEEKPKQTRKKAEKVETLSPEDFVKESNKAFKNAIEEVKTLAETQEDRIEAIEVVEPETVSAPTLEDVRALVRDKIAISRDNTALIKSKLIECGSQNVSTLDAKHFKTIFDFLTEL